MYLTTTRHRKHNRPGRRDLGDGNQSPSAFSSRHPFFSLTCSNADVTTQLDSSDPAHHDLAHVFRARRTCRRLESETGRRGPHKAAALIEGQHTASTGHPGRHDFDSTRGRRLTQHLDGGRHPIAVAIGPNDPAVAPVFAATRSVDTGANIATVRVTESYIASEADRGDQFIGRYRNAIGIPCLAHARRRERRQNSDKRDADQQFDCGKAADMTSMHFRFHVPLRNTSPRSRIRGQPCR